jgi:T-complex protein 1 subunit delta
MRASNKLVLEEAERSLHDALCVIRCLVKEKCLFFLLCPLSFSRLHYISGSALIAGGGAPEIQISVELRDKAQSMIGMDGYCFQAFAEAMEIIPLTLYCVRISSPLRSFIDIFWAGLRMQGSIPSLW